MSSVFKTLGPLRTLLGLLLISLVVMRPFAGGPVRYTDWSLVPGMVVPALVPIVFFVIMLDMIMTNVFRASSEGAERARFARILKIEAAGLVLLLAAWIPFFASLGN